MLKKFFVYEWKDSWKIVGGLNVAVLLLSILGGFFYRDSFYESMDKNSYLSVMFMLYNILYFALIIALALVTGFFFYYRFFRNLYTDEGYLMHTLPVNAHQLIWAKTFVALIWHLISALVMVFASGSFINNMIKNDGYTLWDVLKNAWNELSSFLASVDLPASTIGVVIFAVLIMIVSPFYSIFMGYLAISLGQLTKKHKLLAAVGIYFGLTYAVQIVLSLLSPSFARFMASMDDLSLNKIMPMMTLLLAGLFLIMAGVTAACYFMTHMVMQKKLNLE